MPDTPGDPDTPVPGDDQITVVPDPEPIAPDSSDNEEPIIVVAGDREGSGSDKIIVTNDGVTTVRPDNYDLAVFLGMFGAITGLTGSAAAPSSASQAVQQARQESSSNSSNKNFVKYVE